MQLVTPSVVPTAVSTAIITCKIVFQTSFFIFFFLSFFNGSTFRKRLGRCAPLSFSPPFLLVNFPFAVLDE